MEADVDWRDFGRGVTCKCSKGHQRLCCSFSDQLPKTSPDPPRDVFADPCPTDRTQCCRCTSLNPKFISQGHTATASCKCMQFARAQSMITLHCSTRKRQSKSNATSAGASLPNIFSSIPQTFSYAPQNVLYLSPPTQGFSFKPFTSPSSSEEPFFFFSARVFQFKGCLCYQKK